MVLRSKVVHSLRLRGDKFTSTEHCRANVSDAHRNLIFFSLSAVHFRADDWVNIWSFYLVGASLCTILFSIKLCLIGHSWNSDSWFTVLEVQLSRNLLLGKRCANNLNMHERRVCRTHCLTHQVLLVVWFVARPSLISDKSIEFNFKIILMTLYQFILNVWLDYSLNVQFGIF